MYLQRPLSVGTPTFVPKAIPESRTPAAPILLVTGPATPRQNHACSQPAIGCWGPGIIALKRSLSRTKKKAVRSTSRIERTTRAMENYAGAETVEALAKESMEHGDIIVQDIKSGMNFGLKLLWAMRWMSTHYSFDFFLRLDDDYFICLERLLDELDCFSLPGGQSSPIYAGYRACRRDHEASYVDESYILLSSVLIDRILASSDLKCSGYGSLTAGAWLRIGGPGNPDGDVAFVNDYRLDRWGSRWGASTRGKRGGAEYEPVCEKSLGIHRTYPDHMYELWVEVTGRLSTSQAISNGCDSMFQYEDDGKCPFTSRGVNDTYLAQDNVQPCNSFTVPTSKIYCGGQGC
ncbi:unnamed protein product [Ascophyllum nodosum]